MNTSSTAAAVPATDPNATATPVFKEVEAIEGFDLSARLPQWDPSLGVAIKGIFLGSVALPSTIATQEYWHVFAVRLTGPTMVVEVDPEDPKNKRKQTERMADAPEVVLITVTATLDRLAREVNNPRYVREIYLKPGEKTTTRNGFQVQTYKHIIPGKTFARSDKDRLPAMLGAGPSETAHDAAYDAPIPF